MKDLNAGNLNQIPIEELVLNLFKHPNDTLARLLARRIKGMEDRIKELEYQVERLKTKNEICDCDHLPCIHTKF